MSSAYSDTACTWHQDAERRAVELVTILARRMGTQAARRPTILTMIMIELGQIGNRGEPTTTTIAKRQVASIDQAHAIASELLRDRGVSEDNIKGMLTSACAFWTDDFATRTSIKIYQH